MTLEDAMSESTLITDLRLSFSRLSEFDRLGPKTLINRTKISGEFLDFGSLVDDMLQPGFNINDQYYIFDGSKPTAMLNTLCEELLTILYDNEDLISIPNSLILSTIKDLGLWKTTKDDNKLLSKFTDEARNYVIAMVESQTKKLVTNILVQEAEEMVALLKTHKYTNEFFKSDLIHQASITFRYRNFNFLSLLDYIQIDHENKTIRGIDLKTGSKSSSEFISNFIKYRYYHQAGLYQKALEHYNIEQGLNYTILPFKFLYCGRYEKLPTFITVTDKWIKASENGFQTASGYTYKGLKNLTDDMEWHWVNGVFNMSKMQYTNHGESIVDDSFITVA